MPLVSQTRSARNTFVDFDFDRATHLRDQNDELLRLQHEDPHAVELVLSLDSHIATSSSGLHLRACQENPAAHEQRWYLGRIALDSQQHRHFFVRVQEVRASDGNPHEFWNWADLRLHAAQLSSLEAGLAAFARGLQLWHSKHRFCGVCGSPTVSTQAGHRRVCTNPDCKAEHFPRTDPAVIMAVQYQEQILLGRQASWPEKRFSTLAGFVEPGESLENAVRREVFEEAGIWVQNIDYHSSQPWPFPASLMLGFTAEAESMALNIGEELQEAHWFTPSQVQTDVLSGALKLPPSVSVSHRLIEHWYDRHQGDGALLALLQTAKANKK